MRCKNRTLSEWLSIIMESRKSGLTDIEWCRRNDVKYEAFKTAAKRLRNASMPSITPHVCRHTYCTNMARSGMNPKTLQYLMGHSDISVTMNTYTHLGLDAARDEMIRMEELEQAKQAVHGGDKIRPINQMAFKAV